MTIDQLQARVGRLERRQAWTLRLAAAGGVVLAAGALMAQATAQPGVPPRVLTLPVKASSFELVDAQGRTQAVLRTDKGVPVMQFHDEFGSVALRLTVRGSDGSIEYADGSQMLSLMKPAPRLNPLSSR
jgi:hypothetical protein